MSKTRDTGFLANVIQVHDTGVRIMSGSEMLMAISSSGQVTITGELSGSDAANSLLLDGTGSLAFTTTASFLVVSASQQQISSSLLQVSASYTSLSGSYNTFSGSVSTRITTISSSQQDISSSQQQISASLLNVIAVYATTGSNSFRANQSITGSLVVSSTITAQTLVVQTVTSSIVYSSGSNIFGSALGDRQTFTGSMNVTGSGTFAGSLTTGGTITLNNASANYATLNLNGGAGYGAELKFGEATGGYLAAIRHNYNVGTGLEFYTCGLGAGSLRMYIAPTGNVGVNTTNPLSRFDVALQGCESFTIGNCSDAISCGDLIGALTFVSRDGSTNSTGGIAGIRSYATQTYNTGGVEGDMRFYVSAVGTQPNGTILSGQQVLRLSQDGIACFACRVCVPSLSVSNTNAVLTIQGTATSGEAQLDLSGKNSSGTSRGAVFKYDSSDIIRIGTSSPIGMRFETSDVTRLTIASTGVACFACQVCSPQFTGGFVCAVGGLNVRGASTTWSSFNSFPDNPGGSGDQCKTTLAGSFVACTGWGPQLRFSGAPNGFIDVGQDCNGGFVVEATDTPRLNITQCGNVGFSEPNPGTDKMVILGGTANSNVWLRLKTDGTHGIKPQIHFDSGLVGTNRSSKAIIMGGYNSPTGGQGGVMQFYTNDTNETSLQRMCIDPAGQVTIMGALAKGSGSFRICHPLSSKVKTHALVHSFIEGPNADLIYSGHTKLIGGVSCINIDCVSRMTEGTFEALNRCVRIFTTNESSWSAVRGRVCRNIVLIESQDNTSEDEISWMVIGERHDQHMFDTEWTDSDARVITEPELVIVNDEDITE